MKISAVVPAYNEADRIEAVLAPLKAVDAVDDIVVVDDGSTDGTAHVARTMGVDVVRLATNRGKAAALDRGVQSARHATLLFLDADLVGLRAEQVKQLVKTYLDGSVDMVVGVFKNGRLNTDLSQTFAPYLSGQRVLSKAQWQRIREQVSEMDFGVEIALKKVALKEGWREARVELDGVTHVMKEEKRGLGKGLKDRFKMYGDIVRSAFTKVG